MRYVITLILSLFIMGLLFLGADAGEIGYTDFLKILSILLLVACLIELDIGRRSE